MTSKERMLCALTGKLPDRLPVTTHHVMTDFLHRYCNDMDAFTFHKTLGFDPIVWSVPLAPAAGQRIQNGIVTSDDWRVRVENVPHPSYKTTRYYFDTPEGTLSCTIQENAQTGWLTERLLKEKEDLRLLAYAPAQHLDVDTLNRFAGEIGQEALVRGGVCCFQPYGQPGCWQDLACLFGIENLILMTYDDPDWVREALDMLFEQKKTFVLSTQGARYDLMELGGGDASTTVISPAIFREFVAPYDSRLIALAHQAGQRIVYHTCGGMMPILEDIADMGPDAMETFTPVGMGGDTNLAEAKLRIGHRVCMIGGFDQGHDLFGCTEAQTRAAVRACFEAAGKNGGFILSPSDHFFDADMTLLRAFADEARACVY